MIADAIALYDLVRRIYGEKKIIAALFDWEGKRLKGDERLKVCVHDVSKSTSLWYYSVHPLEDHHFIRIPVNVGGVVEDVGLPGQVNPEAEYFRYTEVPDARSAGPPRNVKVSFMVFAYRPADLLATGKGRI